MADDSLYFIADNQTAVVLTDTEAEIMREHMYSRMETIGYFSLVLNGLNLVWLMVVSIFLFMMQVGFAFMASGAAHEKNAASILTNHLVIICATAMVFMLVSSDLVQNAGGGLVGTPFDSDLTIQVQEIAALSEPALKHLSDQLFGYIRCLTCVTIAATQLQERTLLETYLVLAIAMAGIVFPLAQSWLQGDGWLQRLGYIDSTSASCIYLCGGVAGLVGNVMLGSRLSVFQQKAGKAAVNTH